GWYGKQANGLPGWTKAGTNFLLWTLVYAAQSKGGLFAGMWGSPCWIVQSRPASSPWAVYAFIVFSASMTFWRVKFGPAFLRPVTNMSASIQPVSESSCFFLWI